MPKHKVATPKRARRLKDNTTIGLTERIRRARIGQPVVIPVKSKQEGHKVMREAHSVAVRTGHEVITYAAKIVYEPLVDKDAVLKAVIVIVLDRQEEPDHA